MRSVPIVSAHLKVLGYGVASAILLALMIGSGPLPAGAVGPGCTIMVDSADDDDLFDDVVTLREAISFATDVFSPGPGEVDEITGCPGDDDNPGAARDDIVMFDLSALPPGTPILLGSSLPTLVTGVDTISGGPTGVTVDGAGIAVDCFTLNSNGNVISNVEITGCSHGILIDGTTLEAAFNVVDGNVISGNVAGVRIDGIDAHENSITRNKIGTDATGSIDVGNMNGIEISNSDANLIHDNLISGSDVTGIVLVGDSARNQITGNKIGTDATGTAAIGNGYGIATGSGASSNVIGGTTSVERNVISGNGLDGVVLGAGGGAVATYDSIDVPVPIPDMTTALSSLFVGEIANVIDVDVELEISHTFDADLDIRLMSPDGTIIDLSTDNGGSGDNYTGTIFDDEAATAITGGSAPFAGSFRPEGLLAALDGTGSEGLWTLQVGDDASPDVGSLEAWSLTLTTEGNQVLGNYIGTTVDGNGALGNGLAGVVLNGSSHSEVGGADPGAGNVISSNGSDGVQVFGSVPVATSSADVPKAIVDNGTITSLLMLGDIGSIADVDVTLNITHAFDSDLDIFLIAPNGLSVDLTTDNGGAGDNYTNTTFDDEALTPVAGSAAPFSGRYRPEGPLSDFEGTPIGGIWTLRVTDDFPGDAGVLNSWSLTISSTGGNLIQGNKIGTNAGGTAAIANGDDGIDISNSHSNEIGAGGVGNLVSGNSGDGIVLAGVGAGGNVLEGNVVGLDAGAQLPLGNTGIGVWVSGAPYNRIGGATGLNVIAANGDDGVRISFAGSTQNFVDRNYIGVDILGGDDGNGGDGIRMNLAGAGNVIGSAFGLSNVISGNGSYGIQIFGGDGGNHVRGNLIGTDVAGTSAVGNNNAGILVLATASNTIGGTSASQRNVISGNLLGVSLNAASSNLVLNNYIGTQADGASALGNLTHGLHVTGSSNNNTIGSAGAPNRIRFNGGDGVFSESGLQNRISANSINSNGGLGIDLGANGVTLNDNLDGDSGANNLQNFPVITSLFQDGSLLDIGFSLNSAANTLFTIEFFQTAGCDAGGYGEGATLLLSTTAMTNGSGNVSSFASPSVTPAAGAFITATATDPSNNTSEFSAGRAIAGGAAADDDCDGVSDTLESGCGSDPLTPLSRPERTDGAYAGVDDDGDVDIDEPLPPGSEPYDCDGDGFTGTREAYVGTHPQAYCSATATANDEAVDTWPPDFDDNRSVNVVDFTLWRASYASPPKPLNQRADLNASGSVNVLDFGVWKPYFNTTCLP